MLKEMHEQPTALLQAHHRAGHDATAGSRSTSSTSLAEALRTVDRVELVACGTRLLRRARRRSRDPGLDGHPGPGQHRLGVPLQPAAARRADAGHRRHPVGRDRRHDRPDPPRPRARLPDHRGHEHRRLGDHPRGGRGPVPAGRPGDRGRRLQDVRDPGHDAGDRSPRPSPRPAGTLGPEQELELGAALRALPGRGPGALDGCGRRARARPALRQLARVHVRRARLHATRLRSRGRSSSRRSATSTPRATRRAS